jgi:hypothetical protein
VFFRTSLLLNELATNYLPQFASSGSASFSSSVDTNTAAAASLLTTPVHPAVAIGAAGLLANALNFLPIGRLDGGRVALAIAGRNGANSIGFAFLVGQAVNLFNDPSPLNLFFMIFVVILQRGPEMPPQDDVTPVATDEDDRQKGIAWGARLFAVVFCSLIAAATILPVPIDPSTIADSGSSMLVGDPASILQSLDSSKMI